MTKNPKLLFPELYPQARQLYAEGNTIKTICQKLNVSSNTVLKWKKIDEGGEYDWDEKRKNITANYLSKDDQADQISQMMNRFISSINKVQDELESAEGSPMEKGEMISRIADAYIKITKAIERTTPQLNELSIVKQVIKKQEEFIKSRYPQHLEIFAEILEPFSIEILQYFKK